MFKMIIADDETIVRKGLRNVVQWSKFDIEVIAEAIDGEEALQLCEELHPDILFTDIRMPIMDGLEVATKLKEQDSPIKIIIISGTQDFSYAQTALKVNAAGYLLKPIIISELEYVVAEVVKSIVLENNTERKIEDLKTQVLETIPILKDNFLRNLVSGYYNNEEDILSKLSYLKIPLIFNSTMVVCVVDIEEYTNIDTENSEEEKQLINFAIKNISEDVLNTYAEGVCYFLYERQLVMLINITNRDADICTATCNCILSYINKFLKVNISIGIGETVLNMFNLKSSYNSATTALQYKFYTGTNSVLDIRDIKASGNIPNLIVEFSSLYETENSLMSFMKIGDKENMLILLSNIFSSFNIAKKISVEDVQNICSELISIASRVVYAIEDNIENILLESRFNLLNKIYEKKDIETLKEFITSIFITLTDYFSKKYVQKNSNVINKIKDYINMQYMKEISVAKISEEVYLSPNYISLIFKKETGETITDYITQIRIEAAKQLLKFGDLKVLEVAEMVGYENPQYFSAVFKKYTGFVPLKYRSSN